MAVFCIRHTIRIRTYCISEYIKSQSGFVKLDGTLKRILDLMKEQGVTAVGMEDLLEGPRGSFSNWKRGMGKSYYEYIDKIADRLGVTIDYLIRGKEIKTDSLSC